MKRFAGLAHVVIALSAFAFPALARDCEPSISREDLLRIEAAAEVCFDGKKVVFAIGKANIDKKLFKKNNDSATNFAIEEATMIARQNFANYINGGAVSRSVASSRESANRGGKEKYVTRTDTIGTAVANFPPKVKVQRLAADDHIVIIGLFADSAEKVE